MEGVSGGVGEGRSAAPEAFLIPPALAGRLPRLLAPPRSALARQRPLSRDRSPPGADGLPAPGRQRRGHPGAGVCHRRWPRGHRADDLETAVKANVAFLANHRLAQQIPDDGDDIGIDQVLVHAKLAGETLDRSSARPATWPPTATAVLFALAFCAASSVR